MEAAIAGRDYVLGDTFSAADVYFGSQIELGPAVRLDREAPGLRQAYSERLQSRPAYKRASEIDDALIPAKTA